MNRRYQNSKRLALFSAGLLGLFLQLLWIDSTPRSTGFALSIEASVESVEVAAPSMAALAEARGVEHDVIGRPGIPARGSARGPSTAGPSASPGADRVVARFRVTEGSAQRPLIGVRVHAGPEHLVIQSGLRDLPAVRAFRRDPVRVAIEQLPVFESDAMGIVEVPLEGSEGVVAAVSVPATVDSPALEAWIHPSEVQVLKRQGEPFPLLLRARQEWTFRAVDRWGRGRSGISVKAQFLRSAEIDAIAEGGTPSEFPFSGAGGHPSISVLGTTDDDGLLAYARAPLLPIDSSGRDPLMAILLAAEVPAAEQVPVLIDKLPPPGTVIDLPLPPSGHVTAQLLDHDERPLPGWHELDVLRRSTEGFSPLESVLALNGAAMVGGMPIVESLRVRLGADGGPATDIAGPQHDGGDSRAVVRAGPDHAVLLGRIMDRHGQVLANQRLEGQGAGWETICEGTDADGRFSVLVPLAQDRGLPQAAVFEVKPESDVWGSGRRPEYRVRLDFPLEAATYDLGDLSPSGPRPLLAAGRVTMAADVDCDGYDLQVEFRAPDDTWHALHGIEASHTPGGSFTIHGDPEPWTDHRLVLRVRGECQLTPEPIAFTPGAREIHIELDSGSSLSVRVATPLTIGSGRSLARAVDFVLEKVGGAVTDRASLSFPVSKYGNVGEDGLATLHWHGLHAGAYRLRVLARGTDRILAEIPQIGVSSQVLTTPGVLDLTAVLYRFQLNVVGSDGAPLSQAGVRLNWVPGSSQAALNLRGPSCVGIAPRVPVQVTTQAKGYVTDSRALLQGPQQIVMQSTKLASTRIQVTGLDLPEGVHSELIWGPANLPRDAVEASGFGAHEDLRTAVGEQRTGRRALVGGHPVEFQHAIRPGPTSGLRLILALSALPPLHRPNAPTRILLDEQPGWLLSNPQPATATLVVDAAALQEALTAMGRQ